MRRWLALLHRRRDETRYMLVTLVWGGWLLLPFITFTTSPTFREMRRVASESAWGLIIAAVAALHLCAILRGSIWLRRLAGYLTAGLWIYLTALFVLSNPMTTAVPIYALIAVGALWTAASTRNGHGT